MTTTAWQNMVRGVAIADAWGDKNEFKKIEALTENDPRGPDLPEKLRITDDTQMTLYLGAALDDAWDDEDDVIKDAIIENFLTYNDDPDNNRAPGLTVTGSLNALSRGRDKGWQAATSLTSDGSGTVMRTSPTAFLPEDRWVGVTAFAAAVTHGTANGIAAAILNVAILREILAQKIKPGELLARALQLATHPAENGLLEVGDWLTGLDVDLVEGFDFITVRVAMALQELPKLQADPWATTSDPSLVLDNGGWRSPHTLVIALLALDMFPGDAWSAVRRAVTTDGDSDTIGAVAGALAGAAYPDVFLSAWPSLRGRFEERYLRWIELEADEYPFEVESAPRGLFHRLLRR